MTLHVIERKEPQAEKLPRGVVLDADLANAYRLQGMFGNELRYVHGMGWFVWAGSHWKRDEEHQAEARVQRMARWLETHAADLYGFASTLGSDEAAVRDRMQATAARYLSWAKKSQTSARVDSALEMAKALREFSTRIDELDSDPMLLACTNGTVDLRTGKLRSANPTDLITRCVPVAFDAAARCPVFDAFFARVFADQPEVMGYVRRAVGYSLTARSDAQCLFVLWGSGANGKSTFLECCRLAAGDYAQTTPTATLMHSQKSEHRNDVARLVGARFVTASESAEGKQLDEELIKRLTGGDKMAARFLRKEFFEFTPVAKFWIATNHKPEVRGTDNGIWRRLKLIPFTVTIPEAEQDTLLAEKLKAEAAGVLAWAVRGCLEWQQLGLQAPSSVADATKEWRKEADHVRQFVDECCVTGDPSYVKASGDALYTAYAQWAKASGHDPVTGTAFGRRLGDMGFASKREATARMRVGISVRERDEGGRYGDRA